MFSDLREEQQDIIRDLTNKNIELQRCYEENLKLCKQQEQQINQLQKRFNDYQDRKIEENANLMKKLDIADKKLTVFSRELEQANKENENLKQQLEIDKNQINYFIEENEKLKKTLQELENLSLKTYDVADF